MAEGFLGMSVEMGRTKFVFLLRLCVCLASARSDRRFCVAGKVQLRSPVWKLHKPSTTVGRLFGLWNMSPADAVG